MHRQIKNSLLNLCIVIDGVKAKKLNKMSMTDIISDIDAITSKTSLQNLGTSLKAIGLYMKSCMIISKSQSSPKTIAGININQTMMPSVIGAGVSLYEF